MGEPVPFEHKGVRLYLADALDLLPQLPEESIDAVVTDPPYELGFMGRAWDASGIAYNVELWKHCLRVLKPGGHLLAFGGTRTWHRLACAVEDAGFEIRDTISWLYGSGFPKSLDVSKAIDKRRNDDIAPVGEFLRAAFASGPLARRQIGEAFGLDPRGVDLWAPQPTDNSAKQRARVPTWEQWQRLRELIGFDGEMDAEVWRLNGRKGTPGEAWDQREVIGQRTTGISTGRGAVPYIGDSDNRDVTAPATDDARRWSGWGTALKPAHEPIVVARKPLSGTVAANVLAHGTGALNIDACRVGTDESTSRPRGSFPHSDDAWGNGRPNEVSVSHDAGRWPSNVVLDEAAAAELDRQSGTLTSGANPTRRGSDKFGDTYGEFAGREECTPARGVDTGGASRFFPTFKYQAKAPAKERPKVDGVAHPTVKPLELMRWLVRLVTPAEGIVLDPFAGSGTTAEACILEGFACVTVDNEPTHLPLIFERLNRAERPS